MKKNPLFLCVYLCAGALVTPAHAQCPAGTNPNDSLVAASFGSGTTGATARTNFRFWVNANYYRTQNRWLDGWGTNRTAEMDKHDLGVWLVEHGVAGPKPRTRTVPSPLGPIYVYDSSPGFSLEKGHHRSADEYGPVSRAKSTAVCQNLNPFTGAISTDCSASLSPLHAAPGIRTWHWEHLSWVEDFHPAGLYDAVHHWGAWDAFYDPDRAITYYCPATSGGTDPVYTAATIVHEAWHHYAKHSGPFGECNPLIGNACDTWVSTPRSTGSYGELAEFTGTGLGSYQIDHRFLCDLAQAAAPWVPIKLSVDAAAIAYARGSAGRWSNLKLPAFTCNAPPVWEVTAACSAVQGSTGIACATDGSCPANQSCATASNCCFPLIIK